MSICQIEEINKGGAYPKSCPTCGLDGSCVKGLRHPWTDTIRGLPDIDLSKIKPGDDIHVRFRVLEMHNGLPIVLNDSGGTPRFRVSSRDIVAHMPGPLTVRDRVMFQGIPQTIVALDHGTAWIRSDTGIGQLCDRYELARDNGRPA